MYLKLFQNKLEVLPFCIQPVILKDLTNSLRNIFFCVCDKLKPWVGIVEFAIIKIGLWSDNGHNIN